MKKPEARFNITAKDLTKRAMRSVSRRLNNLRKTVFSVRTAVVGLAGVGGFGLLIKSSLNAIDNIGKMSKLYRISTEDIGAMSLAAEIGGTKLETMLKASRNVSRQMFDFQRGVGEAKDAMEAMGLTVEDVAPLMDDQIGLMALLAENVNKVESSVDRLAIAQDLFGGRATVVLNALEGGQAGMEAFRKESELLGGALSGDAVRGVESANDSITRLMFLVKGLSHQLTAAVAPAIEAGVTEFRNWILAVSDSEGGIEEFSRNAAISVLRGVNNMISGLRNVIDWIEALKQKLEEYGVLEKKINVDSIGGQKRLIASIDQSVRAARGRFTSESTMLMLVNERSQAVERLAELETSAANDELGWLERGIIKNKELIEILKEKNIVSGSGGGFDQVDDATSGVKAPKISDEDPQLAGKVEALQQSLLTEEQRMMESYDRRSFMVEDAFQNLLISEEYRKELLVGLEEQHEAQKTAIAQKGEADRRAVLTAGLGAAANIFGSLSSLMGKAGKKQNAMQKVLGRASILTSTAVAVMNALEVPPYPLGLALAAGAALQGAQQLRNVGGGSGGISAPVASPASQFEQSQPVAQLPVGGGAAGFQDIRVTVDWENATPDQIDQLADSLSKNMANGGRSPVAA